MCNIWIKSNISLALLHFMLITKLIGKFLIIFTWPRNRGKKPFPTQKHSHNILLFWLDFRFLVSAGLCTRRHIFFSSVSAAVAVFVCVFFFGCCIRRSLSISVYICLCFLLVKKWDTDYRLYHTSGIKQLNMRRDVFMSRLIFVFIMQL